MKTQAKRKWISIKLRTMGCVTNNVPGQRIAVSAPAFPGLLHVLKSISPVLIRTDYVIRAPSSVRARASPNESILQRHVCNLKSIRVPLKSCWCPAEGEFSFSMGLVTAWGVTFQKGAGGGEGVMVSLWDQKRLMSQQSIRRQNIMMGIKSSCIMVSLGIFF